MDVKFDRLNDVNGRITVTLEEADYADKVKKIGRASCRERV